MVFYAACLSNITPPVCVSAFAAAAIAKADPMKTGFSALKYGTILILIPYSFVYMPELLLQGSWLEISMAAASYAFGYAALAVAIQGTDFFPIEVTPVRRAVFLVAASCFLFPMILWLKIIGAVLLAVVWGAMPLFLRATKS